MFWLKFYDFMWLDKIENPSFLDFLLTIKWILVHGLIARPWS